MPIYEYQCTKCNHHLEALQRISDKPLRECPECGKHTLKRLMSAPLFRLAGSGWYETDFKSDKEQKRNLVGDKGESGGGIDATAKVEPKPQVASESKAEPKKDVAPPGKKSSRTMITRPPARPVARGGAGGKAKSATRKPARRTKR